MLTRNPPVPPSSPPVTTKVELLIEAIEGLVVAVNVALKEPPPRNAYVSVKTAREEMATALRDFLQPTLRVVGGRDAPPTRNEVVDFTNDPFNFGPPKKQ